MSLPPRDSPLPSVLFLCTGNYYRSRFAELLFNHLAVQRGSRLRADSAGLAPHCWSRNPGPISVHVREALKSRGIAESVPLRAPRDVTDDDFQTASLVIALKQAEHQPMIRSRFPARLAQVRFWHIDDVPDAAPEVALPQIEAHVVALLRELEGEHA